MQVKAPNKILKKIEELKRLRSGKVTVGFPKGGNAYPDGTSVASVATWQEFGTRDIPSRPFFRNAITRSKSWSALKDKIGKKIMEDDMPMDTGLNIIGQIANDDIKESIRLINSPAISEYTQKKKNSSKPLIDTGHMIGSVTWVVH